MPNNDREELFTFNSSRSGYAVIKIMHSGGKDRPRRNRFILYRITAPHMTIVRIRINAGFVETLEQLDNSERVFLANQLIKARLSSCDAQDHFLPKPPNYEVPETNDQILNPL